MTPVDVDQVELLPCPFCSGEAVYEHLENTRWSVGCTDDEGDCMGFQTLQTFARKVDAKRAWNTRAALTPAQTATPALMTVIIPDQWEPCSPAYLTAGGSCADAPRVWNENEKNHWHPKLPRMPATPALMDEVREVERLRSILRGLELCNDGYALRNVYDGDADSDGRHMVVGGEIVATFVDSDDGEELRDAILAFSTLSRGASAVEDADHVAAAVADALLQTRAALERGRDCLRQVSTMRSKIGPIATAAQSCAWQITDILDNHFPTLTTALRALPPEGVAS